MGEYVGAWGKVVKLRILFIRIDVLGIIGFIW